MPTIVRPGGFTVAVYPNDHIPAHVHVFGGGSEAAFNLNRPDGPVELRENYGFSERDIGRVRKRLDDDVARLCREWRRIHGQSR